MSNFLKNVHSYSIHVLSLGLAFLLTFGLSSCELIDPMACTEELRIISIEVTGEVLDETYTIRQASGDTVAVGDTSDLGIFNAYVVLDDSYKDELEGEEEPFRFVGLQNGNVLVDELFEIGADQCHIYKVSGKDKVEL